MGKIKIAVHHTKNTGILNYSNRWLMKLKEMKMDHIVVDMEDSDIIEKVHACNGVMWHWAHSDPSFIPREKNSANKILEGIEASGCKSVFPNYNSRWHYDEKVAQYYLLSSVGAPIIRTYVFWKKDDAIKFLEKTKFPIIFKLSVGAGSSNVLKFNNKKEAAKYINIMFSSGIVPYTLNEFRLRSFFDIRRIYYSLSYLFLNRFPPINYFIVQKNYVYFQEYLNNPYDIRVTVIGDRAFGFTRKNRYNDFRASGSGMVVYDLKMIPSSALKIALDISKKCNFQSMAYDFLLDKNGNPKIGEISYCYVNKAIYNCPGYWDRKLNWHEGHYWPEDLILEDFLREIEDKID
jgi:hypothetical protein